MTDMLAEYIAANPNDPMTPVLRAVCNGGYSLQIITPADRGPYSATPATCMVLIEDSTDVGPLRFHLTSLRYLVQTAACIVLNSGPRNKDAASLLVEGVTKLGKSVLIEADRNHAADWLEYIERNKRKDCGFFAILPDADKTKMN